MNGLAVALDKLLHEIAPFLQKRPIDASLIIKLKHGALRFASTLYCLVLTFQSVVLSRNFPPEEPGFNSVCGNRRFRVILQTRDTFVELSNPSLDLLITKNSNHVPDVPELEKKQQKRNK
jgi:hypothetical protein